MHGDSRILRTGKKVKIVSNLLHVFSYQGANISYTPSVDYIVEQHANVAFQFR